MEQIPRYIKGQCQGAFLGRNWNSRKTLDNLLATKQCAMVWYLGDCATRDTIKSAGFEAYACKLRANMFPAAFNLVQCPTHSLKDTKYKHASTKPNVSSNSRHQRKAVGSTLSLGSARVATSSLRC